MFDAWKAHLQSSQWCNRKEITSKKTLKNQTVMLCDSVWHWSFWLGFCSRPHTRLSVPEAAGFASVFSSAVRNIFLLQQSAVIVASRLLLLISHNEDLRDARLLLSSAPNTQEEIILMSSRLRFFKAEKHVRPPKQRRVTNQKTQCLDDVSLCFPGLQINAFLIFWVVPSHFFFKFKLCFKIFIAERIKLLRQL